MTSRCPDCIGYPMCEPGDRCPLPPVTARADVGVIWPELRCRSCGGQLWGATIFHADGAVYQIGSVHECPKCPRGAGERRTT